MCNYTQVEYHCGHLRYLVRSWCIRYQETHKRCQPNVVAIEYRLEERCTDCRDPPSPKYRLNKVKSKADNLRTSRSTSQDDKPSAPDGKRSK